MKLIKGLQTDSNEQDQPESSYIWALNWVANTKMGSLVSERGFAYRATLELEPIGIMPTADKVVIFSTNGLTGVDNRSEIGIYDEATQIYTAVLNDDIVLNDLGGTTGTGLNFSLEHQIKSVYRFNSKNELEIAFTDWFNPPKIMFLGDIEIMQFYYSPYSVNKIKIFQTALLDELDVLIESSGSLIADTYFVFYRYKNIDLTTTNAYVHPDPLYIIEDNIFDPYIDITGNDIGGTTNKSIRVTFTTVDPSFPFIEVGLYQVSTASSFIVATVPISQESVIITSFAGDTVLPEEILAGKVNYTRVKTITSINDQLMLGNLERTTSIIPQKYINALNLNYTCTFIDPAALKQSKDYNKQIKSFCAGEVYSVMIRFLLSDGSYTQWQHIPGRKPRNTIHQDRFLNPSNTYNTPPFGRYTASKFVDAQSYYDKDVIPQGHSRYSNYTSAGTQNLFFHTTDTCDVIGSNTDSIEGSLGYWENESEQYSQYFRDEDLQIWDNSGPVGNLIDASGSTVRHHRFPTLHFLEINSFGGGELNFTRKFPQLGLKVTNLDINFLNSVIQSEVPSLSIQTFELGFSARDFNNCTVYAQDLSLFGVYISGQRNIEDPPNSNPIRPVYQGNISIKDAIYFTGSNSVVSALSYESTKTLFAANGDITGSFDGTPLTNFHHCPIDPFNSTNQLPNRQRFHTPDLVDPLDPSRDPLITPSYVRHEVLMVCGDEKQTIDYSVRKALYTTESPDTDLRGDTSYSLIDYCHSNDNANTALGEDQYKSFCIKNMPTDKVLRNIKGSGYVPKGTRTVQIGDNNVINALFNITDTAGGGGDLYGGSNHFHVQLFDKIFDRVGEAQDEQYPNTTAYVMAVYGSFLTEQNYSGASPSPGSHDTNPDNVDFYRRHPVPSLNFSKTRSESHGIRQHHSAFLCSLTKQTKTIYNNFTTIQVVQALQDHRNTSSDPTINPGDNIFLGDCFISEVQYITHGWGNPEPIDVPNNPYVAQNFALFRFYAHTRKNLDYRYEKANEAGINNQYYPASRFNVNVIPVPILPDGEVSNTEIFFKETGKRRALDRNHAYQGFNYAPTYGFQPVFTRVTSVYSNSVQSIALNTFPFRVHSSEKQAKESLLNNWRVFLPLNYHENDKTKGEITNLQGYDDQLLIHTIQSLFITRDRGNLESTAVGITIGTGGLFDFPPKEAIFDNLGYTGTQHQFGCAMTKLGYVFPDAQQGKYFIYNKDSGVVELSQLGMFNYFKTYGRSKHNDYYNDDASGLSSWNACYDEFNNRIIIGFQNQLNKPDKYPGETSIDPKSYTLSYSDSFKSFTSFHSYVPDLICNTRQNVYSFKGKNFYKHNDAKRDYYLGDPLEQQEIDIVFNTCLIPTQSGMVEAGRDYTKLWQSFNWLSQVHVYGATGVLELETFTKASVRTDKQCSQLIDLVPFTSTRLYDSKWYLNKFRDKLNRSGSRFQNFSDFIKSLNEKFEITYPVDANFNTRFVDNYTILRLIYLPGTSNRELHLIQVDYTNKIVKK